MTIDRTIWKILHTRNTEEYTNNIKFWNGVGGGAKCLNELKNYKKYNTLNFHLPLQPDHLIPEKCI